MDKSAYFNSRALFIGYGLTLLFKMSHHDILFSIIFGFILGIIFLYFIKNINNYKLITTIMLSIIVSISIINLTKTLYLENTPLILIICFTLLVVYYISSIKSNAWNRFINVLYALSIVMFIIIFLSLVPHIKIEYLRPINIINYKDMIKSSIMFFIISTYPIIRLNDLNNKKEIIPRYIISSITILLMAFIVLTVLGEKEALLYRYPEYIVLKRIKMLDFISNVDNILFFAIYLDLIVCLSSSIRKLNIKVPYLKVITLFFIGAIVYVICNHSSLINTILEIFIPLIIIMFILTIIPKIFLHKKSENNYLINR